MSQIDKLNVIKKVTVEGQDRYGNPTKGIRYAGQPFEWVVRKAFGITKAEYKKEYERHHGLALLYCYPSRHAYGYTSPDETKQPIAIQLKDYRGYGDHTIRRVGINKTTGEISVKAFKEKYLELVKMIADRKARETLEAKAEQAEQEFFEKTMAEMGVKLGRYHGNSYLDEDFEVSVDEYDYKEGTGYLNLSISCLTPEQLKKVYAVLEIVKYGTDNDKQISMGA